MNRFLRLTIAAGLALSAASGIGHAQDLSIGSSVHSLFSLPLYLAKEKGFFEQEGLNVEIINFSGGSTATPALLGGSVVLQSAATENMLKVVAAGQPIKAVMTVQSTLNGALVIPQAVADRLGEDRSLESIKGLRIGTLSRGGMADMAMRYIASDLGLNPESDLTLMPMKPDAYVPSMQSGDIDGALTVEPQQTLMVDGLGGYTYLVDMLAGEGPDVFQDMGWISLQGKVDWLEENEETVRKVVKAMIAAQKFVADEKNLDEVAKLMEPIFPNLEPALLRKSIEKQINTYKPYITEEIIKKNNDLLMTSGVLQTAVEYETVVDESYSDLWKEFEN